MVDSSSRISRALLRFLLSMAEMSRFFRLEKPVDKDPNRGLVLGLCCGDETTGGTSTSVVVSVSVLEISEMEGAIDLFGDSTPSGTESSTTHCQDPYSRLGRGCCPSDDVGAITRLVFNPSATSTDTLTKESRPSESCQQGYVQNQSASDFTNIFATQP